MGNALKRAPTRYPGCFAAFCERFGQQAFRTVIALGISVALKPSTYLMFTLSGKFFRSDRAARVFKFDFDLIALLANEFPQPEPGELRAKRLLGVAILDRRKPPPLRISRDHRGDLVTGAIHPVAIAPRSPLPALGKGNIRPMLRLAVVGPALQLLTVLGGPARNLLAMIVP